MGQMQTKDYCREAHGVSVQGAAGGAAYTGRAIDTRPFRHAQSNLHVVRQATVGGGAGETVDLTWQSSLPAIPHPDRYPYDGVNDGDENMGAIAATFLQGATSFVTVGACSVHAISLWMTRVGNPAYAAGGVANMQVEIFTDGGAGVPGATVLAGNVGMIPTASIAIVGPQKYTTILPVPLDLAAATRYFVVATANYDVSATDYIALHFNTVGAPAQRSARFNAAWAVLGVENFWFDLSYMTFAAEAAGILPDVAHTQVTDLIIDDAHQRREINLTELVNGPIIRPVITVGAGATVWNLIRSSAILSDPLVLPTADLWDCPSGLLP